jgi:acetyltransferase-like isoleucine patch superfamily enzyme
MLNGSLVPVILKKGCKIGGHSSILGGVTIGEGAVVAANTVVTQDVEPYTMVGGIPSRPIKRVDVPRM